MSVAIRQPLLRFTPAPRDAERRLRVLVVDDQELTHWGFKMLLARRTWVDGYLAAAEADDAVEIAASERPDVALVAGVVGGDSGAYIIRAIREASPGTHVLLMAVGGGVPLRAARAAGATGYVPKDWPARDIAIAARMVGLGMTVFAPDDGDDEGRGLSDRELEVLEMIAAGATNREIADRLFISPHTVKDHTSALYRKIGARNRAQAILRAQRLGILG